jgi:hypothetical protein
MLMAVTSATLADTDYRTQPSGYPVRRDIDSEREALSFHGAVASPRTSSSVRLTRLS